MTTFTKLASNTLDKFAKSTGTPVSGTSFAIPQNVVKMVTKIAEDADMMKRLKASPTHLALASEIALFRSMTQVFGDGCEMSAQVTSGRLTRVYTPELCAFNDAAKAKFEARFPGLDVPDARICLYWGNVVIPLLPILDDDGEIEKFTTLPLDGLRPTEIDVEVAKLDGKEIEIPIFRSSGRGAKFIGRVSNYAPRNEGGKLEDKWTAQRIIDEIRSGAPNIIDYVKGPRAGGKYFNTFDKMPFGLYPVSSTSTDKGVGAWENENVTLKGERGDVTARIPNNQIVKDYILSVRELYEYTDLKGEVHQPSFILATGKRAILYTGKESYVYGTKTGWNFDLEVVEWDGQNFIPMPEGTVWGGSSFIDASEKNALEFLGISTESDAKPTVVGGVPSVEDDSEEDMGEAEAFTPQIMNSLAPDDLDDLDDNDDVAENF